jgi:hypothetical protein
MGRFLVASTRKRGQSTQQREQRLCTDPLGLFPFLGRGAETRCRCCQGAGLPRVLEKSGRGRIEQPPHTRGDTRAVATRGCAAPTATADGRAPPPAAPPTRRAASGRQHTGDGNEAGEAPPAGPGGLALAGRNPARRSFGPQAGRTTERSEVVRAPGNEVFALLGRTGTGQCPVGMTAM